MCLFWFYRETGKKKKQGEVGHTVGHSSEERSSSLAGPQLDQVVAEAKDADDVLVTVSDD